MTTRPLQSITDEQLAEIEAAAIDVKGWTMREHFQEPEEGFLPEDWEWYVGAIDEEGNRYPLLNVNAHQYGSGDSEKLSKYYALVNRDAMLALITRLRAAEKDAARYRWLRERCFGFSHDEAERGISTMRWGEWQYDTPEGHIAQMDMAIDAAMANQESGQ